MASAFLDTSLLVELLRGALLRSHLPSEYDDWLISVTAPGEFRYGAAKSLRPSSSLAVVEQFISGFNVVPVGDLTASVYAELKLHLAREGALIPDNDLWIASSAVEHGIALLSTDRHFERLPLLNHHLIDLRS